MATIYTHQNGFIVPDDFFNDDRSTVSTQFCISQSIIAAASERAKTLQWHCIPEENCILDKETLSWITADDDTENSPDVRSAKGGCLFTQSHADHVKASRTKELGKIMCRTLRLRTAGAACSPRQVRQLIDLVMFYFSINERG